MASEVKKSFNLLNVWSKLSRDTSSLKDSGKVVAIIVGYEAKKERIKKPKIFLFEPQKLKINQTAKLEKMKKVETF